ncbi:MAG: HipA domain-containing protein [Fibromonadaceae bacterium]|jgi:serine/threonine-protein kinase HipA|nr:HipA domain-containing protein [Fibromonadaceae bacterium]
MQNKEIFVYFDSTDLAFIGLLRSAIVRGKEVFSFNASNEYIKNEAFRFLDPDLGQFSGSQYLRSEKPNFGIFMDSAPDRWGRLLLRRREAIIAKKEKRREKTLLESDYLLGIFDGNRMGALRFKAQPNGAFLDNNADLAAPPITSLKMLEESSLMLESEKNVNEKWLQMLVAPGSSLGGSRPKANVVDKKGNLWIAKFPSKLDDFDKGAWEAVTCKLARMCKITVSDFFIKKCTSKYHTFLTLRFDRKGKRRIHIASAMTMLGYSDGNTEDANWLEIAEFIIKHGGSVKADLEELWRRLVFSIAISNSDCHLRNHAFILNENKTWSLTPAYDMNPDPYATGLALNVNENNNSLDFDLALDVAPFFRVQAKEAKETLQLIKKTVGKWQQVAAEFKIPKKEIQKMERAFYAKTE